MHQHYRKYFEHQCIHHPQLQHREEAPIFAMIDVEEALGDLRTKAKEKSFLFRLIHYTYALGDNGTHQLGKEVTGGFLIAKYFSNRKDGKTAYYQAMADAERVVDEILKKMIHDSQAGHSLWNCSLNSRQQINIRPLGFLSGDANYAGWVVTFSWTAFLSEVPAVEWTDGGTTPEFREQEEESSVLVDDAENVLVDDTGTAIGLPN